MTSPDIPRGRYRGERVGKPVTDEAEHFIRCPACDGWIARTRMPSLGNH
jgi:hypothetical protein